MRAVVVGGGIGGLAAAVALDQAGVDTLVCEQAPEGREEGAGLTLWSNGVRALRALGGAIASRVVAASAAIERFEIRTSRGEILGSTDFASYTRRFGAPNVCVPRRDLLAALAAAVEARPVRWTARCVGFASDEAGVTVHFAGGASEHGDFLVGADGLHSTVRAALHGGAAPRRAGYLCWRALARVAPAPLPAGLGFESWGRGARFAVLPCGSGGGVYWYATRNARSAPAEPATEFLATFAGWHAPIAAVLAATAPAAILRHDLVDRPPLARWGRGRVTLLGDAAHPATPNFGQGAAMALEDALSLAAWIRRAPVETALRAYEAERNPPTAAIVRQSRAVGWVAQWQGRVAVWLRRRLALSAVSQRATARRLETLLAPPAAGRRNV